MKALILTASGVEDCELLYPYYRFQEEGWDVDVASPDGAQVVGKHGYGVAADLSFAAADADRYDVLLLPGGRGPETVRLQAPALAITRQMFEADKLIAAICHGPQILISAGVLPGRHATCWPALRDDLKAAGAAYLDREVIVDGNLITSRSPSDLPAFCRQIFAALRQTT